MIKMKTRALFLLFAVSLVALCMFTCGCTAQEGSPSGDTAASSDQNFNPGDMPEGDGNMTPPEGGGPGGRGGGMDLAAAAEALGVTEDELTAALGTGEEGGRMDLESAASQLGVTVEELQEALGFGEMPEGEMPEGERPEGGMPDGTPPGEPPA